MVEHVVAARPQQPDEVRLELEAGVVGADRDACHRARSYGPRDGRPLGSPAVTIDPRTPVHRRRRPVPPPRRRRRRRPRAGGADGARDRRRGAPTPGSPAHRRRLDPRRQLAVVAVRQPGVGRRRAPRPRPRASSPTRRPAGTRRSRSSTRRRSTSWPARLDVASWSAARRGGRGCGPASSGAILDWPKAPDDQPPVMIGGDLDMTHPAEAERGVYLPVQIYPMFETAIRAAAGRVARRAPRRRQRAVGRASATSPPTTRPRGSASAKSAEEIRTTSAAEPPGRRCRTASA